MKKIFNVLILRELKYYVFHKILLQITKPSQYRCITV